MIIKAIYSEQLGIAHCIKDDSINILFRRHCGIKIQGHYFLSLLEIYYLLNYKECMVCRYNEELKEQYDIQNYHWINDPVDFLNTFKPDVHRICAYIQIRNMDLYLSFQLKAEQMEKVNQQIKNLSRKKVAEQDNKQNGDYEFLLYKTISEYKNNLRGLKLSLVLFKEQVDQEILKSVDVIGLMENGEVKLIMLEDM
ncbi:unnamed protein product [Paramecium sonneborni]|uniref:Uncharacterized protein n=1 Tax=Paramecium sonneborni TaxID=65129 RepID=A0A8S1NVX2_9CILI|nr:unnamed protein product [Paramecium sonneborni]CAD8094393.1 unnamed protein product [Paramecium sonneborni]